MNDPTHGNKKYMEHERQQTHGDILPQERLDQLDQVFQQGANVGQTVKVYHTVHQRWVGPVTDPVHDVDIFWDAEQVYQRHRQDIHYQWRSLK